jgi:hypothetical protein
MCLLRFKNNFLTIGQIRFRFENSCFAIECVRFASKIILFYLMCSLHFENNFLTIEGVRFASISKKTPLSKLSLAFVFRVAITTLYTAVISQHLNLTLLYADRTCREINSLTHSHLVLLILFL